MTPTRTSKSKNHKSGHSRMPMHSKTPASIHVKTPQTADPVANVVSAGDKLNVIIQVPGDNDVLKVKIPKSMSIGEIKAYLSKKFGEDGKYLFLSQISNTPSKGVVRSKTPTSTASKEKVGILVKSSVGDDGDEAKFMIPKAMKVKTLKQALAKKFGLAPSDFELVHVGNTSS